MNDWSSRILPGQRDNAVKVSVGNFFIQARKHLAEIMDARESLLNTYMMSQEDDTQPDSYDCIITAISTMSEPVRAFCKLIDSSTYLPLPIAKLCYQLVVDIHDLDEEQRELISLMIAFRPLSKSSSKQAVKQRQEILLSLEQFIDSSEDILKRVRVLLDQTHFQVRRSHHTQQLSLQEGFVL
jgi:hypothetical protein